MKEPKFPRLQDLPKDNKYDFFAEGIFPEEIEEKQKRNKNLSIRKLNRFPLSIPPDAKKVSNTQKDEELVPFFAKNYPPSSESKEEICLINSPPPSDTPDNSGEAEEVEEEEEEEDELDHKNQKKNKKAKNKENNKGNNNLNNDDIGVSVDFNSEMEYELEHPSKMMSREEVHEMLKKNEERKREERRKKEEEEKRKKIEEENKKKEEEKKRKDKEEKERAKEKEKEKERLKKLEDDKKKKMKSSKKEPVNALSSIKKNYDDTSNIASNSMINDVQNIFAIPEEKGENEEDEDDTKKNFRKSSKEKYARENSEIKSKSKKSKKLKDFNEEIEKNQNKKNAKANSEDETETKETDINKKSKTNKNSRKSNGIKVNKEEKDDKLIQEESKEDSKEEEKEEEYSNYGDQLADSDLPPKKEKVPTKKKKNKIQKAIRKINMNNQVNEVVLYHTIQNIPVREFDCIKPVAKTFGETRQYSLRNRIHTLRHELGERAIYVFDKEGLCNLTGAKLAQNSTLNQQFTLALEKTKKAIEKRKKKLRKGLYPNNDTIPEEQSEYNSDLLNSENISEFGNDDKRILKIPKGGKKSLAKNFDTVLIIKIIEASGKNMIKVDKKEYKNLTNDNEVKVDKNQEFEILNFSNNNLVVQLVFDEDN